MQYDSQNARFSSCDNYRYSLRRSWQGGKGQVLFIGLNPSTADHRRDDPTIRRCVGFARGWGFERMEIVNLFAYRATYPRDLKAASDPVGRLNDRWIRRAYARSDRVIACWGSHGDYLGRADAVAAWFEDLYCLKLNKNRQPAHPLYLRASLQPRLFPCLATSG